VHAAPEVDVARPRAVDAEDRGLEERRDGVVGAPARDSNLQLDFNVSVFECFDARTSAVLRALDESHRFVQKSAESTSM